MAICGQQLSTKAAAIDLGAGRGAVRRQDARAQGRDRRRPAGAARRRPVRSKVSYFRDLAEHVHDGELDLKRLPELSDEEVIAELTAVKGIGRWTAEMFLIFHLGRPDVLSTGDLGIRKGDRARLRPRRAAEPEDELEQIGEKWRPHRTLACLYFWRSLDNTACVANSVRPDQSRGNERENMKSKLSLIAAAALALGLIAAGCGDDDDDGGRRTPLTHEEFVTQANADLQGGQRRARRGGR